MNNKIPQHLKTDWINLASRYSNNSQLIASIFELIASHYNQPHRHYHTLQHLFDVFDDLANPIAELVQLEQDSILFAVWFHDIIYQPGRKDNEAKSAEIAVEQLKLLDVPKETMSMVHQAILCTHKHKDPNHCYATELFLDADMAILGKSKDEYYAYTENVRKEFSRIPNILYNKGRKNFLETVNCKTRIFLTNYFHEGLELNARENITQEIASLN